MKSLISQLLIAALLIASLAPAVQADDDQGVTNSANAEQSAKAEQTAKKENSDDSHIPDTRPTQDVHLEYYLQSCDGILNAKSEDYERLFVENAKNESQMLQILYDGHLILSKLFVEAFITTLGQTFGNPALLDLSTLSKRNYKKRIKEQLKNYKKLATGLELLGRSSDEQMNQFIWKVLDSEVAMASVKTQPSAPDETANAQLEIRFNQIDRLVTALKSTSNRTLVETALRDVVSQALLSFAREILLKLRRFEDARWDSHTDTITLMLIGTFIAGLFGGGSFTYHHLSDAFWSNHYYWSVTAVSSSMVVSAVGAPLGMIFGLTGPSELRAQRFGKRANSVDRIVYVIPKGSSNERLEISEMLKMNEDSQLQDKSQAITLSNACEGRTCDLTPMQIATVGDLDLLELERLFATLRDSFGSNLNKDTIRNALAAVIQSPDDYRAQMNLRRRLDEYRKAARLAVSTRTQILEQVLHKISVLKTNFALVRKRPFTEIRSNDEEVARGMLLLSKINSDLVRLDSISLDAEKFQASIDRANAVASSIDGWLNSLPDSEHGWREAAQNILNEFDQAEAMP